MTTKDALAIKASFFFRLLFQHRILYKLMQAFIPALQERELLIKVKRPQHEEEMAAVIQRMENKLLQLGEHFMKHGSEEQGLADFTHYELTREAETLGLGQQAACFSVRIHLENGGGLVYSYYYLGFDADSAFFWSDWHGIEETFRAYMELISN